MVITRTKFIRILRTVSVSLFLTAIAAYAAWRSFAYAQGPRIEIFEPSDGATISSSTIEIVGKASRINSLKVNGNALSIDEVGNFKTIRAILPGVNFLTFDATDQFGRSIETRLEVVGVRR